MRAPKTAFLGSVVFLAVIFPFIACAQQPKDLSVDAGYGRFLFTNIRFEPRLTGGAALVEVTNKTECDFEMATFRFDVMGSKKTYQDNVSFIIEVFAFEDNTTKEIICSTEETPKEWEDIRAVLISGSKTCRKDKEEEKIFEEQEASELKEKIFTLKNKTYGMPGFKGIYLRMPREDLDFLLEEDEDFNWKKRYSEGENLQFLECWSKKETYTDSEDKRQQPVASLRESCNIGCEGKGENKKCYEIDYLFVEYYRDKVVRIGIGSPQYSAKDIDPYVASWAHFALKGLTAKHGTPTKSPQSYNRLTVFSFKDNYYTPMYLWRMKGNEISINGGVSEFQYKAIILYDDLSGLKDRAAERKKHLRTEF